MDESVAQLKHDFADLLTEPLGTLNAWRIEAWRRDRLEESVQPIAANKLQALGSCLNKAVEWRLMDRNPIGDLKLESDNEYLIELFAGGIGHAFLRDGWSQVGVDWTWTLGQLSVTELPVGGGDFDMGFKLHIAGIFRGAESAYQRIAVLANDVLVGQVLCRGTATYEFMIPALVLKSRKSLTIALKLPDARRPTDYQESTDSRFLALRVAKIEVRPLPRIRPAAKKEQAPQPDSPRGVLEQRAALQELVSLGFNCEFGFVQRWVGSEPMSLFRWSDSPLDKLIVALKKRLVGLTDRNALDIQVSPQSEFVVEDKIYGFRHHTFVFESRSGTLERVKRNEYVRMGVLSKTLIEELREEKKLFVFHDANKSKLTDIRELVNVLNTYGNNTLLWLVSGGDKSLIGTAETIEPGLMRGHVGGFQEGQVLPTSPHLQSWISVACQAHKIWRDAKELRGRKSAPNKGR